MEHMDVRITLKNAYDVGSHERGIITEPEIHQTTIQAMVDTGTAYLVINRKLLQELGLNTVSQRRVSFVNGADTVVHTAQICKMTEPVEIHWEDRFITMPDLLNIINLRRNYSKVHHRRGAKARRRKGLGVICKPSAFFLFVFIIRKRIVGNAQHTY